jgi:3-oxoacyl-[acyl-carrier-protein] synthase II
MAVMELKRVVVTGAGAITPIGNNAADFWDGLVQGRSGLGTITHFDPTDFATKIAAEVRGFSPEDHFDRKEIKKLARFTQFGIVASRDAVQDSGIKIEGEDALHIGVIVGVGIGAIDVIEEAHATLVSKGPRRVSPFLIPKMIPNMASGQISIYLGAKGPNTAVSTACATGTHAIGDAFKLIQRGDAIAMICGGAEAVITPLSIAGFSSAQALSERNDNPVAASRPFDAQRDGFVMGEGAGVLILEELGHAIKRGAKIYAEIVGYGLSGDAFHMTAPGPEGEGGARAMKMAVDDAGIPPTEVNYVNAHGTSTPLNDKLETQAIKTVFGDHARKLAISSNKSMIGHLLGAAGGVEAIATVRTIHDSKIPPTMNYEFPDPDCDLDYVPNVTRETEVNYAISNSLGFGGHNCTICFKKYVE